MTEVKPVTISIAVHNNQQLTAECLDSIFRYTRPDLFDLVVTDNASTDGTWAYLERLRKTKLHLKTIRNEKNLGFLPPHNAVFAEAKTKFFLVLNNDLTVCGGWLEALLAKISSDSAVIACGIKNTCIALDERGIGVPGEEPEYIEGSCLLVRSELVRALKGGLFDPIYRFAYFEDSDFGLRARHAGHEIRVVDLPIRHLSGATTNIVKDIDLEGYRLRNQHIFLSRWGSYLSKRKGRPVAKNRIVVRRAGAQGDVILATPILRALRRDNPKGNIIVETICKNILDGNPDVNDVVSSIKPQESDLVIDLNMAYEARPLTHILDAYAEVAGVTFPSVADRVPQLFPNDTARVVASQRMPPGARYAIIHPGLISGWVGRQWEWKRWNRISQELKKKGYKTVLVGTEATPNVSTDLDFRGVSLMHFVALMERTDLFCGLDSMPFHVAQATRKPSVVLFGSIDPALRVIPGLPVMPVVAKDVGCLGCHHLGKISKIVTTPCWRPSELCMSRLTEEQVLSAIDEVEAKWILPESPVA